MFRIIINSFGAVLMFIMSYVTFWYNFGISFLFLLSAVDQVEDVIFYAWGKRLIPSYLAPIDIILELVLLMFGGSMFAFSLLYFMYFSTWFFQAMMVLSVLIIWSSAEDIDYWLRGRERAGRYVEKLKYIIEE